MDEPDYDGLFFTDDPLGLSIDEEWGERVQDLFAPSTKFTVEDLAELPDHVIIEEPYDRLEYVISEMGRSYHTGDTLFRARVHRDRERRTRFEPANWRLHLPRKREPGERTRRVNPFSTWQQMR